MKTAVETTRRIFLLCGLMFFAMGSGCDGGNSSPEPAPDFTLTDTNADSPTYGVARQLSDAQGRVIVMHFALYT